MESNCLVCYECNENIDNELREKFRQYLEKHNFIDIECSKCNKKLEKDDLNKIGGMNDNQKLILIASMGTINQLEEHLNEGKNINIFTEKGNTVLHAVCGGWGDKDTGLEIIRRVPHYINAKNKNGDTPIIIALKSCQTKMAFEMMTYENLKLVSFDDLLKYKKEIDNKIADYNKNNLIERANMYMKLGRILRKIALKKLKEMAICLICQENKTPDKIMIDVCDCEEHMYHYDCLQKTIIEIGGHLFEDQIKCDVCKKNFKYNYPSRIIYNPDNNTETYDEKVFFPSHNIYPMTPKDSTLMMVKSNIDKTRYSMYFLQSEDFDNNFNNMTKQEINEFIDNELKTGTMEIREDEYIIIKNLPSNYTRTDSNIYHYESIEAMINTKIKN